MTLNDVTNTTPDKPRTKPRTWGEMTPEEKGVLLLAEHEGKAIEVWGASSQCWVACNPGWYAEAAYRVRPECEIASINIFCAPGFGVEACVGTDWPPTHKIILELLDNELMTGIFTNEDGDIIKIEKL